MGNQNWFKGLLRLRIFVAIFLLQHFLALPKLLGQDYNIRFNHLSVDQGLSQSTVFSIAKDKQGLMWFGTRDGLNKYDAFRIKNYKYNAQDSTSLSNNAVLSLLSDTKGNLWVGTSFGLNRYNPVKDNFDRIKLSTKEASALNQNHILSLLEDRLGNIWVGTREGLILFPAGNIKKAKRYTSAKNNANTLVNNEVRRIYQDREGIIWIGTSQGFSRLDYYNPGSVKFTNYFLPEEGTGQKIFNWINDILEDENGLIWLGTEKTGLKFFNKREGKFITESLFQHNELKAGKIRVIKQDKNKDFWIGSLGGLFIVNAETKKVLKLTSNEEELGALSDHSIRSIFIDASNIYWVGTFYGGINYYSRLANQFGKIKLNDINLRSKLSVMSKILTDKEENIWISTDGNGLYHLNPKTNKFINYRHNPANNNSLSHNNIKTIMMEKNGLWIGTLFGLNFFNFADKKFTHYFHQPGDKNSLPDDISYSIKRDSKGTLWVSTYNGGLSWFDDKNQKFTTLTHNPLDSTSLSSNSVTYLFEDSEKNLWVGTTNGLNWKFPKANKFKRFFKSNSEEQSISANYILCIHEDKKKRLWISTQNGINLLEPKTGKVRYFSTKDGLPSNTVYGILEDADGFLWFSTQNGLSRMNPQDFSFNNYNRNDGLISKEFGFNSFHKDPKGYMYFGGFNGIVVFHPDSIRINHRKPEVQYTQLRLYNQEVAVSGEDQILPAALNQMKQLVFRHNQNIFSIEFAVLNFINSNKNQYAYKLEKFDNDWNYVKEPVASYMNLEPGRYNLLIKGSNNDGIWSEPLALAITILPPPWKTWWAYALYAAVFGALLLIWARLNKSKLKLAHELELEHLENKRQEELHQTKINFFANIAHDLRTPLTLVVSPIQLLTDKYRYDPFLQAQLKVVATNTNRLLRLLNQLLDFNKHESGGIVLKPVERDMVGWLQEIKESFQEHAHLNQITLDFCSEYDELLVLFDPEEMEKVIYNIVSNSFKFTSAGGAIKLFLKLENELTPETPQPLQKDIDFSNLKIKILIEDTGIGIAPDHINKIFNRFYQADGLAMASGGFGIGLALSKEIVNLHGGNIAVESKEQRNNDPGYTRFIITLPVVYKPELPVQEPELVQPKTNGAFLETEKLQEEEINLEEREFVKHSEEVTVLLVEDNVDIRVYLKDLLSPFYQVLVAGDGQEGWEIATEHLPNLVISDVSMPRMDGFELTKKLKSDDRTNHIPIILLTARGTIIHQVEGLEKGADEYMSKPFNIQLLLLKAKNLLAVREKLKAKYGRIVTLQPQYEEIEDPEDKFLQKLMLILESNISNPEFNVATLVKHIGMSRPVLFRKTKMLTGLSVIDLIRSVRLKKAEMLLQQHKLSVSEIAYEVGYNDPKYFSKIFRSHFGKTPSEYMEQQ